MLDDVWTGSVGRCFHVSVDIDRSTGLWMSDSVGVILIHTVGEHDQPVVGDVWIYITQPGSPQTIKNLISPSNTNTAFGM